MNYLFIFIIYINYILLCNCYSLSIKSTFKNWKQFSKTKQQNTIFSNENQNLFQFHSSKSLMKLYAEPPRKKITRESEEEFFESEV